MLCTCVSDLLTPKKKIQLDCLPVARYVEYGRKSG